MSNTVRCLTVVRGGLRSTELYIAEAISRMAAIATAHIIEDTSRIQKGEVSYSQQKLGSIGLRLDNVLVNCQ